jgi:hypothetical protein
MKTRGRKLAEPCYDLHSPTRTMIDQKLLEDEAAKCGINIAALVREEITSRMTPITPDEVAKFPTENKAKLQGDDKMLAGQIEAFLTPPPIVRSGVMSGWRCCRIPGPRGPTRSAILTASNLQR